MTGSSIDQNDPAVLLVVLSCAPFFYGKPGPRARQNYQPFDGGPAWRRATLITCKSAGRWRTFSSCCGFTKLAGRNSNVL
jgi:hypothetical protein